jgi:DNA-binding response OmpR family regulator
MGIFNKILGEDALNNQQSEAAPVPATQKKALIVEDDKYLRDFYAELLTTNGLQVITADNGQAGLEMLSAQKPDIVLLDLMMPVMDGKSMLHKMREIPEFKYTPVIILTNAGDADNMRQTQRYDNANAFMIKANVSPEEILTQIKNLIH